jgi:hypothetical protein
MLGRPGSANAGGNATFGSARHWPARPARWSARQAAAARMPTRLKPRSNRRSRPPEWSFTGPPAQEGDEDRSHLADRAVRARPERYTGRCSARRSCLHQPIGGIDENGPAHPGAWPDRGRGQMRMLR